MKRQLAGCEPLLLVLFACTAGCDRSSTSIPADAIGDEPALGVAVEQSMIDAGRITPQQLVDRGRALFVANCNDQQKGLRMATEEV